MSTTQDSLLRGAATAFERYGWHDATLERIAQAAGTTRVTLHRRGVTKESLLAQLVEEGTRAYTVAMMSALTARGNGAERLGLAMRVLCEQAEEHMGLLLALRAQSDRVFHEETEEALTRSAFTEPLERLLLDGVADGSLRTPDPEEAATVLFNLVGWTYVHLRTGHRWPPERASRAVVDVALSGVRTEPVAYDV